VPEEVAPERALTPVAMAVLDFVDTIPPGRVATYGDVARALGLGSPRQVGQVLSRHGIEVPWWRVVMADGRPAPHHATEQLARLRAEGVAANGRRVDLRSARWTGGPAAGPPDRAGQSRA